MAVPDIADQYFAYENRLASFQTAQQLSKRRASNASAKAPKSLKWPHKFLSPEEFAKAGLFFYPLQTSPDNVACFLCHKSFDGWEKNDNPLAEHLKHSPGCGWAIVATIEKQDGELSLESPASKRMIEARKATFSDKWPHEDKRGWKCKTKQMVDAGWKYTPTPESDDMATCTYCSLGLDGWENSDKPLDEHFNRSSDCSFFTLVNQTKSPAAKRTKAKRASKASRLSTQSQLTIASDAHSVLDLAAEEGDSVLTTATNATTTTQGGRKMGKAKKAPAKGKKTRAKKTEPVEVEAVPEQEPEPQPEPEDDDFEVKVEVAPKPTRGRKRKSEQEQDSSAIEIALPPPKRRATRTRKSMAVEDSIMQDVENLPQEKEVPKKARKGRAAKGSLAMEDSILSVAESVSQEQDGFQKSKRGRPSRKASTASVAPSRAPIPNDDEIDAALKADLERMSDAEAEIPLPKKPTRASKISKADHAMFSTEPMEIDEAAIDAELEAMEVESKPLPKAKGAKGKQPRKVSAKQQAAAKRAEAQAEAEAAAAAEAERMAEEEASQQIAAELEQSISLQHSSPIVQPKRQKTAPRQPARKAPGRATRGSTMSTNDPDTSMGNSINDSGHDHAEDSGNETDASNASQSTVVRGGSNRRGSTMKKGGKEGVRHIEEIVRDHVEQPAVVESEVVEETEQDIPSPKGKEIIRTEDVSMMEEAFYTPAPEAPPAAVEEPAEDVPKKAAKPRGRPKKSQTPASEPSVVIEVPEPAEPTPKRAKGKAVALRSPTPPPRKITPSESPQSSDAENHPPSSKPSAATKKTVTPHSTRRMPLAETTTPSMSPSKRNIIAGLQTLHPWSSVDLDTVFMKSPGGENVVMNTKSLFGDEIKTDSLTSPEKRMSVEEWIHYNAEQAEERLRNECERMVSGFEQQGTRAMQALEGIECLE